MFAFDGHIMIMVYSLAKMPLAYNIANVLLWQTTISIIFLSAFPREMPALDLHVT